MPNSIRSGLKSAVGAAGLDLPGGRCLSSRQAKRDHGSRSWPRHVGSQEPPQRPGDEPECLLAKGRDRDHRKTTASSAIPTDECTPAVGACPSGFRSSAASAGRVMPSISINAGRPLTPRWRHNYESKRTFEIRGGDQGAARSSGRTRSRTQTGSGEARADPANNTRTCNKLRRLTG